MSNQCVHHLNTFTQGILLQRQYKKQATVFSLLSKARDISEATVTKCVGLSVFTAISQLKESCIILCTAQGGTAKAEF